MYAEDWDMDGRVDTLGWWRWNDLMTLMKVKVTTGQLWRTLVKVEGKGANLFVIPRHKECVMLM